MSKPLTINLQINVYPDGSVELSNSDSTASACSAAAKPRATVALPSSNSDTSPAAPTPAGPASPAASSAEPSGPSESDVRTALLAAVKASDKATAVGILEQIAGVNRVPDVPADKRDEVIHALNGIVEAAKNAG